MEQTINGVELEIGPGGDLSGKGEIDYDITNATLYFYAQNSDIRRGRRVSDEEAQDRYDEAMRYLDKQQGV